MSLNPLYVIAGSLQDYFVDKDTGLPLSGGYIQFFRDNNRSVAKDVFILSGSYPNYTYVNIGNTVFLDGVGNPSYNGSKIVIYYYPYDSEVNLDLYYVQIFSSTNVEQNTVQAWPNTAANTPTGQDANMVNFVPNGQFLAHNNIPGNPITKIPAGQITQSVTNIAPGGWYYNIPSGSTTIDNIQFVRIGNYVPNPTASPRYSCNIVCQSPNISDAFKYLELRFYDVNKFASSIQQYTFSFTASTVTSPNFSAQLLLYKNFGTGGTPSAPVTTLLSTFSITNTITIFQYAFTFGTNEIYNIGTNDDDYVSLLINFPTNTSFGISINDVINFQGNINITEFPAITNRDFMARTIASIVPDYNGYNLGLPLILTSDGLSYDSSMVGMAFPYSSNIIPIGYLPCDGKISYYTNGYFSDGVPSKRLYNILYNNNSYGMSVFGTGPQYVTTFGTASSTFAILTNSPGSQTITSDGAVPTGFSFSNTIIGTNVFGFKAYNAVNMSAFYIVNVAIGTPAGSNGPGTSGFTVNSIPNSQIGEHIGTDQTYQILQVVVNSFPSAGTYFRVSTPTVAYYVWFQVDGSGSDPSPGGTGIRVNLPSYLSSSTAATASFISAALNAFQVGSVTVLAGSSITPGSYFLFYSNGNKYYVWYATSPSTPDPNVSGGIGIRVTYSTSSSSATVRNFTILSINTQYYATPDLRGRYIKGLDSSGVNDYNSQYRFSYNQFSFPNYIGSGGFNQLLSHNHNIVLQPGTLGSSAASGAGTTNNSSLISNVGIAQNDVENVYMNYIMKY